MNIFSISLPAACLCAVVCLAGCAPRVGIGIPVGPFNIGVGVGSGGVSAGVGTGVGPLGVGIGVQPGGQVSGHAGVGASVPLGAARVGAGVGGSTVLHSPAAASPSPSAAPAADASAPLEWRDASGRVVPQCRVQGNC